MQHTYVQCTIYTAAVNLKSSLCHELFDWLAIFKLIADNSELHYASLFSLEDLWAMVYCTFPFSQSSACLCLLWYKALIKQCYAGCSGCLHFIVTLETWAERLFQAHRMRRLSAAYRITMHKTVHKAAALSTSSDALNANGLYGSKLLQSHCMHADQRAYRRFVPTILVVIRSGVVKCMWKLSGVTSFPTFCNGRNSQVIPSSSSHPCGSSGVACCKEAALPKNTHDEIKATGPWAANGPLRIYEALAQPPMLYVWLWAVTNLSLLTHRAQIVLKTYWLDTILRSLWHSTLIHSPQALSFFIVVRTQPGSQPDIDK